MSNINIGEMTFGDILERSIKLLFSRFFLLFSIELIVLSPTLILQLALPDLTISPMGAMVTVFPQIILGPIGSAAMLRVVAQEFQGRPTGLGDAFSFALRRFLPLLGTSLLAGIAIGFGFLLCCIPGIYLAITWALVSQVVVVEHESGANALTRSASLVKGYFWRVAGILFLVGMCIGFVNIIVNVGLASALPHVEFVRMPNPQAGDFLGEQRVNNYVNYLIVHLIPTLIGILGQTYIAICTTLVYFDLRNRKEGIDLATVLARFDDSRSWRDETVDDVPPAAGNGAPETGIKASDADVPPPQTGIKPGEGDKPV